MSIKIGRVLLNQFRVDDFVASGGMGAVYRVWDLNRNVPLAMKVLHSELADDPAVFKRFQREANALKKLTHPNIVPFYGLYQSQDFAFLLERFIDGPSLKDILRQQQGKPLSVSDALVYLKALCAALGYAHANGVVHCDVKPGNVMVDRGGNVYLTDFGIARHAESTTTTMGAAGTPAYMAPEQIRCEVVSPATDVYAQGVVLFEMLTGQRPFRGTEAGTERGGTTANERIRYGHLNLAPPDPSSLNPNLPAGLARAILKALAKRPQDRYSSTLEFFNSICFQAGGTAGDVADRVKLSAVFAKENLSKKQQGIPGKQPVAGDVPSPQRRSPWLMIGGVVGGLILCMLAIGGIVLISRLLRQGQTNSPALTSPPVMTQAPVLTQLPAVTEPPVATEAPVVTQPPSVLPTDTPRPESPSPQPTITKIVPPKPVTNGEWIAFSYNLMPYGTQNKRDLYEINWETGAQKQLTSGNKGINFPAFSPDGRSLVYSVCPGNDCYIYERDENGNETRLMDTQSFRPDWCQDPSKPWIIFENRDDSKNASIWMINLDTYTPKRITNGPGDYGPDWSPDCSQFTFIRDTSKTSDSGDIYIYNLSSNQETQVTNTPETNEDSVSWSPKGEWLVFTQFKDDNGSGIRGDKGDNSDLTIIRFDGSGRENLTSGKYDAYSPAWSPDGSMIVFAASLSSNEPKYQIIIYFRSSGEFESITGIGPYYHPVWGP